MELTVVPCTSNLPSIRTIRPCTALMSSVKCPTAPVRKFPTVAAFALGYPAIADNVDSYAPAFVVLAEFGVASADGDAEFVGRPDFAA